MTAADLERMRVEHVAVEPSLGMGRMICATCCVDVVWSDHCQPVPFPCDAALLLAHLDGTDTFTITMHPAGAETLMKWEGEDRVIPEEEIRRAWVADALRRGYTRDSPYQLSKPQDPNERQAGIAYGLCGPSLNEELPDPAVLAANRCGCDWPGNHR